MKKEVAESPNKVTPFKIVIRKNDFGNIMDIMEKPYGSSFNASTSGAHLIVNNPTQCHYDFFSGAEVVRKEYPEKENKKFNSPFWVNGSVWGFT